MTDCTNALLYAADELDTSEAADFRRHLESCLPCRAAQAEFSALCAYEKVDPAMSWETEIEATHIDALQAICAAELTASGLTRAPRRPSIPRWLRLTGLAAACLLALLANPSSRPDGQAGSAQAAQIDRVYEDRIEAALLDIELIRLESEMNAILNIRAKRTQPSLEYSLHRAAMNLEVLNRLIDENGF